MENQKTQFAKKNIIQPSLALFYNFRHRSIYFHSEIIEIPEILFRFIHLVSSPLKLVACCWLSLDCLTKCQNGFRHFFCFFDVVISSRVVYASTTVNVFYILQMSVVNSSLTSMKIGLSAVKFTIKTQIRPHPKFMNLINFLVIWEQSKEIEKSPVERF